MGYAEAGPDSLKVLTKNVPVIEMAVAMSKLVSTTPHEEKITCMHED